MVGGGGGWREMLNSAKSKVGSQCNPSEHFQKNHTRIIFIFDIKIGISVDAYEISRLKFGIWLPEVEIA